MTFKIKWSLGQSKLWQSTSKPVSKWSLGENVMDWDYEFRRADLTAECNVATSLSSITLTIESDLSTTIDIVTQLSDIYVSGVPIALTAVCTIVTSLSAPVFSRDLPLTATCAITVSSGNVVLSNNCSLEAQCDVETLLSDIVVGFVAKPEASNYIYFRTSLIGGASGALDAIDSDDLTEHDGAMTITYSGFYVHVLIDASGQSESSPEIIIPDDSGAEGKYWQQLGIE